MSMDDLIVVMGVIRALIWWTGCALAVQQKRGALVAGFGLAGAYTLLSAAVAPTVLSLVSIPISVLIVGSFIVNQPRGRKPDSWSL